MEEEISNLSVQRLGSHNHQLSFIGAEFEQIRCHPCFYVVEATDKRLWRVPSGGCSAEMEFGVISIAMDP